MFAIRATSRHLPISSPIRRPRSDGVPGSTTMPRPFNRSTTSGIRNTAFTLRHAMAMLEAALAGDHETVAATGDDMLASCTDNGEERTAPRWLEDLKHDLEEGSLASVRVGARARRAGAHPAHASRLFRRCYGASITEFAQMHSVRRALRSLTRSSR